MNDAAKTATKLWAENFVSLYGTIRDTAHLIELRDREAKDGTVLGIVMTKLPLDLYATALVHHTSKQIAQQKVREVSVLAAQPVTRREYWNKLDRAHHYVAGALALRDHDRERFDRMPEVFIAPGEARAPL